MLLLYKYSYDIYLPKLYLYIQSNINDLVNTFCLCRVRKMQFLITTLVVVILLVGVVSSCPSVCSCTDTSDGVNVDCKNRGLDSIPTDLPKNTYTL